MKQKPTIYTLLLFLAFAATSASAFYDPGTQRWLNRDPHREVGSEVSLRIGIPRATDPQAWKGLPSPPTRYMFVRNDPVNALDPLGLSVLDTFNAKTWAASLVCSLACAPLADAAEITFGHPMIAMMVYQNCMTACTATLRVLEPPRHLNRRPVTCQNAPPEIVMPLPVPPRFPLTSHDGYL